MTLIHVTTSTDPCMNTINTYSIQQVNFYNLVLKKKTVYKLFIFLSSKEMFTNLSVHLHTLSGKPQNKGSRQL